MIPTTNKSGHEDCRYLSEQNWKCEFQCTPDTFTLDPAPPPHPQPAFAPDTFAWQLSNDHIANDLCTLTVRCSSHTRHPVNFQCMHTSWNRKRSICFYFLPPDKQMLFPFYRCSKSKARVCSIGMDLPGIQGSSNNNNVQNQMIPTNTYGTDKTKEKSGDHMQKLAEKSVSIKTQTRTLTHAHAHVHTLDVQSWEKQNPDYETEMGGGWGRESWVGEERDKRRNLIFTFAVLRKTACPLL